MWGPNAQEALRRRDPWGGPWWAPERCEHVVRLSLVSDAVECVKCARVWHYADLYNLTEES